MQTVHANSLIYDGELGPCCANLTSGETGDQVTKGSHMSTLCRRDQIPIKSMDTNVVQASLIDNIPYVCHSSFQEELFILHTTQLGEDKWKLVPVLCRGDLCVTYFG